MKREELIEMEALACHKCETCDCDGCCIPNDVKGLYQKIEEKIINNFVDYLNNNAFELRHDMKLIEEFGYLFLKERKKYE